MSEGIKINWPEPEEFPLLPAREIHLWCAWLGEPDGRDPAAAGCLSPDEIVRAHSFRFAPDRHRFVAARRNLRHVLAGYVGRPPDTLVFNYGRFGKPVLAHRADATGPFDPTLNNLCFNQSHCGPCWLLAVAWNQPLGVDLEEVREIPDLDLIEGKLFAPEELAHQQALAPVDRQKGFFQRWTQREAATKFQGVAFEPSARYVSPGQGELLTPADGYIGYLAYSGAPVRIQRFGWKAGLLRPREPEPAASQPV